MFLRVLAAVALLAGALPALADNCHISVFGPSFGTYVPSSPTPLDSAGRVRITCKSGATITVSTGGSGTFFPRSMRSGTATLAYNLYVDAARTRILGGWNPGTQVILVPEGKDRTVPFFARIPPQQDVDPGEYSDTLVATVYF